MADGIFQRLSGFVGGLAAGPAQPPSAVVIPAARCTPEDGLASTSRRTSAT